MPKDWARTGTIAGYAKYIREQSDALCVIVLRVNDGVMSADSRLAPRDARDLILERLDGLINDLDASRREKRPASREELGELHE